MNYRRLINASSEFATQESRGKSYDYYMSEKGWCIWDNSPILPRREVMLLFWFVLSWDPNFQGDVDLFQKTYQEIYPVVRGLRGLRLEAVDLNNHILNDLAKMFEKIATCTPNNRFESTDASKILHTILPDLAVMWDRKIRDEVLGDENRNRGHDYAFTFLPKMKEEINEALSSYAQDRHCTVEEAAILLSTSCRGHTLAKILDEHNYVVYTLGVQIPG